MYFQVAQRSVYAHDSLRDFFYVESTVVLLVTLLFSAFEDDVGWGFIFGNSLNWGLVFARARIFGYPLWQIALYLIGGGLFFGLLYAYVAALFGSFMHPCLNCGKKGLLLEKQYCHACGVHGCDHCMMPLFKFDSNFLNERVVVCSEGCWRDFITQIEAIIHKNMSEALSAREKPAEYDGDEGRHVNEALIRAYLSYAQENPNYPHKELVERELKKARERSKLYENMEITWYYNSKKYEESKNPYKFWFPQNQARRAKRALSHQYKRVPYKSEAVVMGGDGDHENTPDSSVDLFTTLAVSRLHKQEELGGPSKDKALEVVARNVEKVILREKREIKRERIEEALKRRPWDKARAADRGVCDWCNEKLKVRDGKTTWWRCPREEGFLGSCHTIFCSERCRYEHIHNVHDE